MLLCCVCSFSRALVSYSRNAFGDFRDLRAAVMSEVPDRELDCFMESCFVIP